MEGSRQLLLLAVEKMKTADLILKSIPPPMIAHKMKKWRSLRKVCRHLLSMPKKS